MALAHPVDDGIRDDPEYLTRIRRQDEGGEDEDAQNTTLKPANRVQQAETEEATPAEADGQPFPRKDKQGYYSKNLLQNRTTHFCATLTLAYKGQL